MKTTNIITVTLTSNDMQLIEPLIKEMSVVNTPEEALLWLLRNQATILQLRAMSEQLQTMSEQLDRLLVNQVTGLDLTSLLSGARERAVFKTPGIRPGPAPSKVPNPNQTPGNTPRPRDEGFDPFGGEGTSGIGGLSGTGGPF